jgi:dUTP pyrophosphatase
MSNKRQGSGRGGPRQNKKTRGAELASLHEENQDKIGRGIDSLSAQVKCLEESVSNLSNGTIAKAINDVKEMKELIMNRSQQHRRPKIEVKIVKRNENATMPEYGTKQSAGMDLFPITDGSVDPGCTKLADTGLIFVLPEGFEGNIRSKSGLALKSSLGIPTGTLDSDYRGTVGVVMHNSGKDTFHYTRKTKIAQMVIHEIPQVELMETTMEEIDMNTERGSGGFGSTGSTKKEEQQVIKKEEIIEEVKQVVTEEGNTEVVKEEQQVIVVTEASTITIIPADYSVPF